VHAGRVDGYKERRGGEWAAGFGGDAGGVDGGERTVRRFPYLACNARSLPASRFRARREGACGGCSGAGRPVVSCEALTRFGIDDRLGMRDRRPVI
jgi:hypothetical protein